jgi:pimeloyl-ACP methyl ester carboxylesterase
MLIPGPAGLLHVLEAGEPRGDLPTVLLLHGLAGRAEWWRPTLEHLGATRHAVAFDLRGHGDSGAPADGAFALAAQAADVRAVCDELGLRRVVLVGHSFGATVAIAALDDARVAGAVLVDAAGDYRDAPPGAIDQFLGALQVDEAYEELVTDAFRANLGRAQPATRERVLAGVEQTSRAAMRGCYEALLTYRPQAPLRAYAGSVLLIGDAANESAFALHAQGTDRPVQLVHETSHWLTMDQPAAFHRLLDDFLDALPRVA